MSDPRVATMVARLEHLAFSWKQGAPIRVGQLQALLAEVHAIAAATKADELRALARKIETLVEALDGARQHAESELAALPARKRAIRAHANSLAQPSAGTRLRRRA